MLVHCSCFVFRIVLGMRNVAGIQMNTSSSSSSRSYIIDINNREMCYTYCCLYCCLYCCFALFLLLVLSLAYSHCCYHIVLLYCFLHVVALVLVVAIVAGCRWGAVVVFFFVVVCRVSFVVIRLSPSSPSCCYHGVLLFCVASHCIALFRVVSRCCSCSCPRM